MATLKTIIQERSEEDLSFGEWLIVAALLFGQFDPPLYHR
jgi:hypothetical protein